MESDPELVRAETLMRETSFPPDVIATICGIFLEEVIPIARRIRGRNCVISENRGRCPHCGARLIERPCLGCLGRGRGRRARGGLLRARRFAPDPDNQTPGPGDPTPEEIEERKREIDARRFARYENPADKEMAAEPESADFSIGG